MSRPYSRTLISGMWIGAVISFLIVECLVVLSIRGQLKELSFVRLSSLPFMVAVPLISGVGFAVQIRKNSQANEDSELARLASEGIATLELFVYVVMSGVISMYLCVSPIPPVGG